MSAREELFESMTPSHCRPAPGEAEDVNAKLDAYRSEVLREVAERLDASAEGTIMIFGRLSSGFRNGKRAAADEIRRMASE